MFQDFIFSLNATLPVFLLMVLGYVLKNINWISDDFAKELNAFVFKLALPMVLFRQLAMNDFVSAWDTRFVGFCAFATIMSIVIVTVASGVIPEKSLRGEFVQASYRSSAALLGVAYITNIYGNAAMAPLMIIGAVPLYNAMAVFVLLFSHADHIDVQVTLRTLKAIITNPIIIGIIAGALWSLLGLQMPAAVNTATSQISNLATPLGLMAMGASIDIKESMTQLKHALFATFFKLIGLNMIFLPLAIKMGFRDEKLVAILIMLGSATTVSSYVMARQMGHEGVLTSNTVVLTTVLATVTLTLWIFILKTYALI